MLFNFENYRLDTDNALLWKGDEQLTLRPKTFDLLRYMVEHAGELVHKETLLDEVWKNSYVVEGVLTTSMSELRKLFGDTAKNQRYIATVYRRGYRFIAPVERAEPVAQSDARQPVESAPATLAATARGGILRNFPRMHGFVGRKQECRRLVDLLAGDAECRILTLVGPGGIGKTRLALNVVEMLSELDEHPFADGFNAVALQSLDSSDDVHSALGKALELQFSGADSQRQHILDYLHDKRLLLLLDNFEHLLAQADALVDIVAAAPGVKILLTSRESLPVPEAWFHPVSGLEYSDAVRLFSRVARRNQPEFDVHARMPAIIRICQLVEGMPLALELAAGWLKMLSMEEVAEEITRGIDILSDQDGGREDRHRSVRAIFNETWQRLSDSERSLLRQFSVFRGGADRNAIAEIIGAGLPPLAALVNKALLRSTRQQRYRMHELIRQFAAEQLAADADAELQACRQHAQYYLGWFARQLEELRSSRQGDACNDIQADFANIRLAWRWAVAHRRVDLLPLAVRALSLYCDLRGHFLDGLSLFSEAQQMVAASDHPERAALIALIELRSAILHLRLSRYGEALRLLRPIVESTESVFERALGLRFLGDYQFSHAGYSRAGQSRQYLEESIALCEQLDDIQLHSECLRELAILHANLEIDIEASQGYAAQAVELARRSGCPDLLASSLDVLAWTSNHRGDYSAAEDLWREVFDLAYRSGNRSLEALATNWLGWSAWSVGGARHREAAQYFSDALLRYRNLGDRANQSMCHADLASVQLESGDYAAALENCRQGLELAAQIGRDDHYVYNLYTQGAVECARGDLEAARQKLARALKFAWEQEEETNKPVVLYYVARLLFAEYQAQADARKLANVFGLLLFLQHYPPTWQTFRDRAARLQQRIAAQTGAEGAAALEGWAQDDIVKTMLPRIPRLL
jgi:predicted ATPase/DNA-binding winged helix-turn-helix (wHTH) protein